MAGVARSLKVMVAGGRGGTSPRRRPASRVGSSRMAKSASIIRSLRFVSRIAAYVTSGVASTVTSRTSVTSYRGNAQLKVLVSRNESNRVLVWEVDGPGYYRSSSIPAVPPSRNSTSKDALWMTSSAPRT